MAEQPPTPAQVPSAPIPGPQDALKERNKGLIATVVRHIFKPLSLKRPWN